MHRDVYLLYGSEEWSLRERIEQIRGGVGLEQYEGNEENSAAIITALQTPSLLFGERVLLIKDVDLKEEFWGRVAPCVKNIAPELKVIFWVEVFSKQSLLYKTIDEIGEVLEFRSFAEWEQDKVVDWIARRVKKQGKDIGREAAIALQEICGSHLMRLASEIEKLITYIGTRPKIEVGDVEMMASEGEVSVFDFTDAVAEKKLREALVLFRSLSRNKVEAVRLLAMLANQFRLMLAAKEEGNGTRLAQLMNASPYYVKKCMAKAAKYKTQELKKDLERLLEADLKLKSGEDQTAVFEILIAALCQPEMEMAHGK